ncbi:MAG: helix-turn-helix domain-containing protein [Oscillospiraceae bacterium]|nr:helix-turn-helix domain-containing protein [Oscillospiraceae bacterium]
MAELRFESTLSPDEIDKNFEGVDVFSGIMDGLQEALAYKEGRASAETLARKRSLPVICVAEVRSSLSMTQREFANVLGVSCRTVEAWESGKSTPTPTARKLMYLIREDNTLVEKLLVNG